MMSETVLIQKSEAGYVKITLNRPKALNALNRSVLEALHHFFSEGYRDFEPFRAVVITGSGEKAFAAGADISEFKEMSAEDGKAFAEYGHQVFFAIEEFDRPVIAAVNGFALGGGCELAMACHLRVASDNARFGLPEVSLGLIPGYGGTQRLIQYVGKGRATEMLITGDMIAADKALEWGLVNRVVALEDLEASAQELIKSIGKRGPLAVRNAIRSVNEHYDGVRSGFASEINNFSQLMGTEDFREGTAAFLEKRRANFKGE